MRSGLGNDVIHRLFAKTFFAFRTLYISTIHTYRYFNLCP